ncbi:MAG TPA: hypothetical protein VK489_07830 [Ferruginibacter sp.]|nr:hypothetical protein [Ferruginibacter sp.]
MRLKILLTIFSLFFSLIVFAEGQDGLGIFISLIYIFFILLYTVIGGLFLKLIISLLKKNDSKSIWFYLGIALIISLLMALIMGDYFIFIF